MSSSRVIRKRRSSFTSRLPLVVWLPLGATVRLLAACSQNSTEQTAGNDAVNAAATRTEAVWSYENEDAQNFCKKYVTTLAEKNASTSNCENYDPYDSYKICLGDFNDYPECYAESKADKECIANEKKLILFAKKTEPSGSQTKCVEQHLKPSKDAGNKQGED